MEGFFYAFFFIHFAWQVCVWLFIYFCVKLFNRAQLNKTYTRVVRVVTTSIISVPFALLTYYVVNKTTSLNTHLPNIIVLLLLGLNFIFSSSNLAKRNLSWLRRKTTANKSIEAIGGLTSNFQLLQLNQALGWAWQWNHPPAGLLRPQCRWRVFV